MISLTSTQGSLVLSSLTSASVISTDSLHSGVIKTTLRFHLRAISELRTTDISLTISLVCILSKQCLTCYYLRLDDTMSVFCLISFIFYNLFLTSFEILYPEHYLIITQLKYLFGLNYWSKKRCHLLHQSR